MTWLTDEFCSLPAASVAALTDLGEAAHGLANTSSDRNDLPAATPSYWRYLRAEMDAYPRQSVLGRRELIRADTKATDSAAVMAAEDRGERVGARLRRGYREVRNRDIHLADLLERVRSVFGRDCHHTGDFHYPPGGFREWHTNRYDDEGWRMYVVVADQDRASFFRLYDEPTQSLITAWDARRTVNFFRISADVPNWHCIRSDGANRWSFGFSVPANWADLIGVAPPGGGVGSSNITAVAPAATDVDPALDHGGGLVDVIDQPAVRTAIAELELDGEPRGRGTLLEHLTETFDLLVRWGVARELAIAGLFHSVLGGGCCAPGLHCDRDRLETLLGPDVTQRSPGAGDLALIDVACALADHRLAGGTAEVARLVDVCTAVEHLLPQEVVDAIDDELADEIV